MDARVKPAHDSVRMVRSVAVMWMIYIHHSNDAQFIHSHDTRSLQNFFSGIFRAHKNLHAVFRRGSCARIYFFANNR